MIKIDDIRALLNDLESDRVERSTGWRATAEAIANGFLTEEDLQKKKVRFDRFWRKKVR